MSHYPQYHTQTTNAYHPALAYQGYPSYGTNSSAYSTTQSLSSTAALPPPPLSTSAASHHAYHPHASYTPNGHHSAPIFDQSGQVAPPGIGKPRITATLWEDEGTLCYQIEANGISVSRREDNNFINGTKLLNVAGMTRGRRDGILKTEKQRAVVKIGPMHLKGVWVPFEKALEFANKEKITDLLFPLFLHNISQIIHTVEGQNEHQASRLDASRLRARAATRNISSGSTQHPSQIGPSSLSTISQHAGDRPAVERAHTFPTPPTSASSVIGGQNNYSEWNAPNISGNVHSSAPLAIDTTLSNARSLPNTPASTPPGNTVQSMQSYQHLPGMNSYSIQQGLSRYGHSNNYIKSEMGPPTKGSVSGIDSDPSEIKQDPYSQSASDGNEANQDDGYSRGHYMGYNNIVDNSIMSPEQVNGSPHQTASGRVTPRTSIHSQQWTGYSTPPTSDAAYTATPASASNRGSSYPVGGYTPGSMQGAKRVREDDESEYQQSRSTMSNDLDSAKRRRGATDIGVSSSISSYDQGRSGLAKSSIIPRIR